MRQETHTQTREMFERKKETALFARPGHSLDLEVLIEFLHDVSMLLPRQCVGRKKEWLGGDLRRNLQTFHSSRCSQVWSTDSSLNTTRDLSCENGFIRTTLVCHLGG